MIINNYQDDIPPHKKKSISKPPKKSKHKHLYKPCLLMGEEIKVTISEYCTICGKIGRSKKMEWGLIMENGKCTVLSDDELLNKHKDLDRFNANIFEDKYVSLVSFDE